MLFVLDANVWLSQRLLRSAVGAAFLHAVRRMDGRILVPSSTREEILAGSEKLGSEAIGRINEGYLTIQTLTGARPNYKVPKPGDFRAAAEERLNALAHFIVPLELTLEHHNRALARVNEHRPPAETREQYRDCLLWESILEANDREAILVSSDKDFLEKGASGKSMAKELEAECGGRISLYVTLADALRAIECEAPPADINRAIECITAAVLPVVREFAEQKGFTLGQRRDARVELFATEQPSLTAAIFDVAFQGFYVPLYQQEAAPEAVIRLIGDCMLDDSGEVTDLKMDYIKLFSLAGEPLSGGIVYLRGIGESGVVPYSVRVPLGTAPV